MYFKAGSQKFTHKLTLSAFMTLSTHLYSFFRIEEQIFKLTFIFLINISYFPLLFVFRFFNSEEEDWGLTSPPHLIESHLWFVAGFYVSLLYCCCGAPSLTWLVRPTSQISRCELCKFITCTILHMYIIHGLSCVKGLSLTTLYAILHRKTWITRSNSIHVTRMSTYKISKLSDSPDIFPDVPCLCKLMLRRLLGHFNVRKLTAISRPRRISWHWHRPLERPLLCTILSRLDQNIDLMCRYVQRATRTGRADPSFSFAASSLQST
jgi:hypothetical protein